MRHLGEQAGTAVSFTVADLPALRRLVASMALAAGLTRSRADDMVLAVNEIATNALVHGRPPATLQIWSGDGELVCEVSDEGDGFEDVLAGQLPPAIDAASGRGLWITRMLCDAVEIRNGSGCTVSVRAVTPSLATAS
jgi:anti-sigma regulatory factor (Ser/Thr protein kinase)